MHSQTIFGTAQKRIGNTLYTVKTLPSERATETAEQMLVLIAANDNLDTANGFDIMSIFRDVLNEWYVADTSKKIRAVKRANALDGKCAGRPPYGYRAVNGSNQTWEIDEPAAEIVREIYGRIIAGDGPHIIGKDFDRRGIDSPMVHYRKNKGMPDAEKDTTWFTYIISRIAENPAYTGQLVSQKYSTPSYKNHKHILRPEDEWVVIENHHVPIVDAETFNIVQQLRANRRRPTKRGDFGVLSGLLFCADCNSKLALAGDKEGDYQYYVCSLNRNRKKHYKIECSRHGIKRGDVEQLVLEKIIEAVEFARKNKAKFTEIIHQSTSRDCEKTIKNKTLAEMKREIIRANRRIGELDKLFRRIYEDNVIGKLSDERFQAMSSDYESEQRQLKSDVARMDADVANGEEITADFQAFLSNVRKYTDITELTPTILNEFIQRIEVHAPDKSTGKRAQQIDIYYNAVGVINIPTSEELEAMIAEYRAQQKQQDHISA